MSEDAKQTVLRRILARRRANATGIVQRASTDDVETDADADRHEGFSTLDHKRIYARWNSPPKPAQRSTRA